MLYFIYNDKHKKNTFGLIKLYTTKLSVKLNQIN